MIAGAMAVVATPLAYPAVATAERVWDIEFYDDCLNGMSYDQMDYSIAEQKNVNKRCCEDSGGVFKDDGYLGQCVAPPGDTKGSRQLPGNVQIPSDLATAPAVTQAPSRPIPVTSDIATEQAVTQAPR
jgi:hypothetical protein